MSVVEVEDFSAEFLRLFRETDDTEQEIMQQQPRGRLSRIFRAICPCCCSLRRNDPEETLRRISYERQSSSRFLNHVQVWLRRHLAPTPPPLRTPWVPPLQTCGRLPCVVDSDVSFETYEDTTEVQVKQQKPQPRPCGMIFPDESQRVLIHIFSQDSIHRRANNEPTQQETGLQII